jgi:hypothetical protein
LRGLQASRGSWKQEITILWRRERVAATCFTLGLEKVREEGLDGVTLGFGLLILWVMIL